MATKTKKSKASKKKSSSSKRSSKTSKASSRSTRQSKGLLEKAKKLSTGKKDAVNALSKSESKRLAILQLEAIGDYNGAVVGMLKVYDGKKVETQNLVQKQLVELFTKYKQELLGQDSK